MGDLVTVGTRNRRSRRSLATPSFALGLGLLTVACAPRLDVGSDVLWAATFESGNFDDFQGSPSGAANAYPAPATVEVSSDRPRRGGFGARLTIDAGSDGVQQNTGLVLDSGLPTDAYYSAWYYLPQTATVGTFWVIFKFRLRANADDAASDGELFDINLDNRPTGELFVRLYDHRAGDFLPLDVPDSAAVVPVGRWFQVEAHYRNAPDPTGHLTFWLDGQPIVDRAGPMAPSAWVGWDVVNVAENLMPSRNILYVDDCAVSLRRIGPAGLITQ